MTDTFEINSTKKKKKKKRKKLPTTFPVGVYRGKESN